MSDYWKSNPRKFCDFCKCWIADNKPSIDFHERGKRHKENVQIRISEMAKKGQEDYEAKQQEGDYLKAMEEAALKAYKSDIEQNPDLTGNKISEIAAASNAEIVVGKKKDAAEPARPPEPKPMVTKKWYEAKSPEGYSYYWNTETGESKWDAPAEGYLTLDEQQKDSSPNVTKDPVLRKEEKSTKRNADREPTQAVMFGPAPRAQAYSSWQTAQPEPQQQQQTDFQLPEIVEEGYYGPELSFRKPDVTFKEKTVTLSASDRGNNLCNIGFKKRKANQDDKKNMRRRNDDL